MTRPVLRGLDSGGFASQVDLAPTLLDLVGVPMPPGFVGRSLLGSVSRRFSVGVYRDTFYYGSAAGSFSEVISGDATTETLRSRAVAKWLRNLDAVGDEAASRLLASIRPGERLNPAEAMPTITADRPDHPRPDRRLHR